jgi:polyhydroxybutyrate depolymerase
LAVRTTVLFRWIVAAVLTLEAGFVAGYASGRLPAIAPLRTLPVRAAQAQAQAGSRSSRLGRTAAPATPQPTPAPTPTPGTTSAMETMQIGGMTRSYQVIRPTRPIAPRLPALVILHGVNATIAYEQQREGLLPVATAGQAILVYPVGDQESWNAGDCCPPATSDGADDVGFIQAVLQQISSDSQVDPSRVTLMGFSNGGRMAYQLDCSNPGVVKSLIVVLAAPATPCPASAPVSLLLMANQQDPEVPYGSGTGADQGLTAVTDVVSAWRTRDGCPDAITTQNTQGQATNQVWSSCQSGTQVDFVSYASGGHQWQTGDGQTPSMQRLIWSYAVASPGWPDPLPQ